MCINLHPVDLRGMVQEVMGAVPDDSWQSVAKGSFASMRRINRELRDGGINAAEWRRKMDQILRLAHINAHVAGQRIGGRSQPFGVEAARVGQIWADQESQFLQGFFEDVKGGRYTDEEGNLEIDQLANRQLMYINKTRATAYDGFVSTGDAGASYDWILGASEENCNDCPVWAEGGPYTSESLATYPGMGDTLCLTNCKCYLVRQSDQTVGPLPFGVSPV